MDERSGVMAAIRLVLAHMYGGLSVDLLLTSSVLLIEWNRTVMLCMGRHDFSQRKRILLVGSTWIYHASGCLRWPVLVREWSFPDPAELQTHL